MRRKSVTGGRRSTPIERNFPQRVQLQSPGRDQEPHFGSLSDPRPRSNQPVPARRSAAAAALGRAAAGAVPRRQRRGVPASCTTATASGCSPTCARCSRRARARTPRTCCRTCSCARTGRCATTAREMNVRAWLYRVAHNRCIDHLRRPVPPAAEVFEVSRKPLHDPVEEAQRRDDLRRLVRDVANLPDQQRSALLMREIDGMTYADLAVRARRHGARGQVAARARADRAGRGRRGARRRLRGDPRAT